MKTGAGVGSDLSICLQMRRRMPPVEFLPASSCVQSLTDPDWGGYDKAKGVNGGRCYFPQF